MKKNKEIVFSTRVNRRREAREGKKLEVVRRKNTKSPYDRCENEDTKKDHEILVSLLRKSNKGTNTAKIVRTPVPEENLGTSTAKITRTETPVPVKNIEKPSSQAKSAIKSRYSVSPLKKVTFDDNVLPRISINKEKQWKKIFLSLKKTNHMNLNQPSKNLKKMKYTVNDLTKFD